MAARAAAPGPPPLPAAASGAGGASAATWGHPPQADPPLHRRGSSGEEGGGKSGSQERERHPSRQRPPPRRNKGRAYRGPVAAAAGDGNDDVEARAGDDPPVDDGGAYGADEEGENPALSSLLVRLRRFWAESGGVLAPVPLPGMGGGSGSAAVPPAVDPTRARNLLEAAAGDVDLAFGLYWDDYVASAARLDSGQGPVHGHGGDCDGKPPPLLAPERPPSPDPPAARSALAVAAASGGEDDVAVRRRLFHENGPPDPAASASSSAAGARPPLPAADANGALPQLQPPSRGGRQAHLPPPAVPGRGGGGVGVDIGIGVGVRAGEEDDVVPPVLRDDIAMRGGGALPAIAGAEGAVPPANAAAGDGGGDAAVAGGGGGRGGESVSISDDEMGGGGGGGGAPMPCRRGAVAAVAGAGAGGGADGPGLGPAARGPPARRRRSHRRAIAGGGAAGAVAVAHRRIVRDDVIVAAGGGVGANLAEGAVVPLRDPEQRRGGRPPQQRPRHGPDVSDDDDDIDVGDDDNGGRGDVERLGGGWPQESDAMMDNDGGVDNNAHGRGDGNCPRGDAPAREEEVGPGLGGRGSVNDNKNEENDDDDSSDEEYLRLTDDEGTTFDASDDNDMGDGGGSTERKIPRLVQPCGLLWMNQGFFRAEGEKESVGGGGARGMGSGGGDRTVSSSDDGAAEGTVAPYLRPAPEACPIPRAWLSAGFSPSPCATGPALCAPPEEEATRLRRRAQGAAGRRCGSAMGAPPAGPPPVPPFHCGGATALLSIVTALLHSGASVQGREANCNSNRTPWADLTEERRKRDYDSRLADALAALLHVAATAAADRRSRAVASVEQGMSRGKKEKKRGRKGGRDLAPSKMHCRKRKRREGGLSGSATSGVAVNRGAASVVDDHRYFVHEDRGGGHVDDMKEEEEEEEEEEDLPKIHADQMKLQHMRRRINLCPVGCWEEDPGTGEPKMPSLSDMDEDEDGDHSHHGSNVRFAISYTNIQDLRAYVLNNIRSFLAPGGCALFLETVVRIHGVRRVDRMVRQARRRAAGFSGTAKALPRCGLLGCSCHERQIHKWMNPTVQGVAGDERRDSSDSSTPPGHECFSTELLSLILTGSVETDLCGDWSTGGLGFGILTMDRTDASATSVELRHPPKPVWLVRGLKCFSVLWLDVNNTSSQDDKSNWFMTSSSLSSRSISSNSFYLAHWNCWYGVTNKTRMRIITSRRDWVSPHARLRSCSATDSTLKTRTVTQAITERMRNNKKSMRSGIIKSFNIISTDEGEHEKREITNEEIESVIVNQEDKAHYPGDYCRWRFEMGVPHEEKMDVDATSSVVPQSSCNSHWIPYYRLGDRDREVVDWKLGPRITAVVRSRWPGASVDQFTPSGLAPVV